MLGRFSSSQRQNKPARGVVIFFLPESKAVPHNTIGRKHWCSRYSLATKAHSLDISWSEGLPPTWKRAVISLRATWNLHSDQNVGVCSFFWRAITAQQITNLRLEYLPYPTYSPNLALCDYHAFGLLKETEGEKKFNVDEEFKEAAVL